MSTHKPRKQTYPVARGVRPAWVHEQEKGAHTKRNIRRLLNNARDLAARGKDDEWRRAMTELLALVVDQLEAMDD